jgi:hypothetical protein
MKHDGYSKVYIERAMKDIKKKQKSEVVKKLPVSLNEMNQISKKELEKRAYKKVFGKVGSLSDRAKRVFRKNGRTPDDMMQFFWIEFKNNYWFGLMSKTSKIAPRHVRLTTMYFGISIQLFIVTSIYASGVHFRYFMWVVNNFPAIGV